MVLDYYTHRQSLTI